MDSISWFFLPKSSSNLTILTTAVFWKLQKDCSAKCFFCRFNPITKVTVITNISFSPYKVFPIPLLENHLHITEFSWNELRISPVSFHRKLYLPNHNIFHTVIPNVFVGICPNLRSYSDCHLSCQYLIQHQSLNLCSNIHWFIVSSIHIFSWDYILYFFFFFFSFYWFWREISTVVIKRNKNSKINEQISKWLNNQVILWPTLSLPSPFAFWPFLTFDWSW